MRGISIDKDWTETNLICQGRLAKTKYHLWSIFPHKNFQINNVTTTRLSM